MQEDTERPLPPPPEEDVAGSLRGGFWLFWLLFPVWIVVCIAILSQSFGAGSPQVKKVGMLVSLAGPLLFAGILALCGKPRTGSGVALGYASAVALVLMLVSCLCSHR